MSNTGGVTSTVHCTWRVPVAVFPQVSVAVKLRVCEKIQPLTDTGASLNDIRGVQQLSIAVAIPNAALI